MSNGPHQISFLAPLFSSIVPPSSHRSCPHPLPIFFSPKSPPSPLIFFTLNGLHRISSPPEFFSLLLTGHAPFPIFFSPKRCPPLIFFPFLLTTKWWRVFINDLVSFKKFVLLVVEKICRKAIYLFGFGVQLFILSDNSTHRTKWNLWVVHRLLITAACGFILFMYHSTSHREKLPDTISFIRICFNELCYVEVSNYYFTNSCAARLAFYRYVVIMSSLNALALFACGLAGSGASFSYWSTM